MENLVCINQQQLVCKEYKGQRVVTFKDIDAVHNRPDGTARRNFKANVRYMIEGQDYFKVCVDEIRTHKIKGISDKMRNEITLLTQTGYLMLVKSFTDELAWTVQRMLVNNYFNVKEIRQHEQLQLEEPYQYIEKDWKGQKVVTVADIVKLGEGFDKSVIGYWARERLVKDVDYFLLSGAELAEFKLKYPGRYKLVNRMYLFTYSGFRKIVRYTGGKCERLKSLEQPIQPMKKPPVVDKPNFIKAQSTINDLKNKLRTISEVLDGMNRCTDKKSCESYKEVAVDLSMNVALRMHRFNVMKMFEDSDIKIDENYELKAEHIQEVLKYSDNQIELLYNMFRFGYMQAVKVQRAAEGKDVTA